MTTEQLALLQEIKPTVWHRYGCNYPSYPGYRVKLYEKTPEAVQEMHKLCFFGIRVGNTIQARIRQKLKNAHIMVVDSTFEEGEKLLEYCLQMVNRHKATPFAGEV